jgi:hypothetical protein
MHRCATLAILTTQLCRSCLCVSSVASPYQPVPISPVREKKGRRQLRQIINSLRRLSTLAAEQSAKMPRGSPCIVQAKNMTAQRTLFLRQCNRIGSKSRGWMIRICRYFAVAGTKMCVFKSSKRVESASRTSRPPSFFAASPSVVETSRLHSLTRQKGEQTAQACANAC